MLEKFDCLARDSSVFGTKLLEASAGTGKTFAIEHIFVRLLLEEVEGEALSIDQILVVTFTKAATRDLQNRIKKNIENVLLKANEYLAEKDVELFDYLIPIFSTSETIKKSIKRLKEAINEFYRAQIFTIHSFCHHVLNEFSFEAGTIFLSDELNDVVSKDFLIKHVQDFLHFSLSSKKYHPEQIVKIIKKNKGIENLCKKLIASLDKEISVNAEKSIFSIYDEFCKSLSDIEIEVSLEELTLDFDKSYKYYKKLKSNVSQKDLLDELSLYYKVINEKSCDFSQFEKLIDFQGNIFSFFK